MDKYHKAIDNLLSKGSLKLSFETTRDLMTVLMSLRSIYYSAESTNLTARAIHHYNQEGIMPSIPDSVKSRKKYNYYQILWLHVIENLRGMGYPLRNIKVIKKEMIDKPLLKDETTKLGDLINFNAFEFIISMAVLSDDPLYFIVLKDGKYSFASDKSIPTFEKDDTFFQEVHLNLPMATLMGKLFDLIPKDSPFRNIKPKRKRTVHKILHNTEWAIVYNVMSKECEVMQIQRKNGKIEFFPKGREKEAAARLKQVFHGDEYEDITFTYDDGKTVTIQNKKKDIKQ